MRSSPVQLNVCDLFYAILFVPDKSLRIVKLIMQQPVLLTTRHPLLVCRKSPPRTYSYALFSLFFFFPMVKNISDMML